jgi:hypothetical protein
MVTSDETPSVDNSQQQAVQDNAEQTPPNASPLQPETAGVVQKLTQLKDNWGLKVTVWLIILVFGGILIAIFSKQNFIRNLSDPGFARGLITFIISVATIGLAFVLVFQSFSGGESGENGFRRAREIFAGLMGVLGTIVGFYFGSTDKPSAPLQVAAVKVADKQLITYVSGGSRPYHYTITSTDTDFKQIDGNSEEGWVVETLAQPPKAGSRITISVKDNKETKEDRKIDMPATVSPQQRAQTGATR